MKQSAVMIQSWTFWYLSFYDDHSQKSGKQEGLQIPTCSLSEWEQLPTGKHLTAHQTVHLWEWMTWNIPNSPIEITSSSQMSLGASGLHWRVSTTLTHVCWWLTRVRKDWRLWNPLSSHSSLLSLQQLVCGKYSFWRKEKNFWGRKKNHNLCTFSVAVSKICQTAL